MQTVIVHTLNLSIVVSGFVISKNKYYYYHYYFKTMTSITSLPIHFYVIPFVLKDFSPNSNSQFQIDCFQRLRNSKFFIFMVDIKFIFESGLQNLGPPQQLVLYRDIVNFYMEHDSYIGTLLSLYYCITTDTILQNYIVPYLLL